MNESNLTPRELAACERLAELGLFVFSTGRVRSADDDLETRLLRSGWAGMALLKAALVAPEWAQAMVTEHEATMEEEMEEEMRLEAIATALVKDLPIEVSTSTTTENEQ